MVIIMLGAPASGKGSVAEILSKEFAIPAISSGDIFRKYISEGTEIGKKANEYITKGELVPDEITVELITSRLKEELQRVSNKTDNISENNINNLSINENLNDEVIVTVIATGFEKPSEPLYHSFNSTKREEMYKDVDDDYNDNDLDIPPFIRDRQDF